MQTPQYRQKGFSLFIVMIIMLVIALLVIVTNQSASTEARMSANDADRKYAMTMAESGLRDAETYILSFLSSSPGSISFSADCNGGLCAPVETVNFISTTPFFNVPTTARSTEVAWKRFFNKKIIWENNNKVLSGRNGGVKYIIEYLGERKGKDGILHDFRVTTRAQGQNPNTVVMLQSIVELAP